VSNKPPEGGAGKKGKRVGYRGGETKGEHGYWTPLDKLKQTEVDERGNEWFDDSGLDLQKSVGMYATKNPIDALFYGLAPELSDLRGHSFEELTKNIPSTIKERVEYIRKEFPEDFKALLDALKDPKVAKESVDEIEIPDEAIEVLDDGDGGFLYVIPVPRDGGGTPVVDGVNKPPEGDGVNKPPVVDGVNKPPEGDGVNKPPEGDGVNKPPEGDGPGRSPRPSTSHPMSRNAIYDVDLRDIFTDKKFQNRREPYSEKTVTYFYDLGKSGKLNWADFPPIMLWREPETQRLYVVSGHSRKEAIRRLRDENVAGSWDIIPSMIDESSTFAEAVDKGRNSNNADPESVVARALYYREKRLAGVSEEEVKQLAKAEGSNRVYILALSYLNPSGRVMDALTAFLGSSKQDLTSIQVMAEWVGSARGLYPELTDVHEAEIYKWIQEHYGEPIVRIKTLFLELMERALNVRTMELGHFPTVEPINIDGARMVSSAEKAFVTEYERELAALMARKKKAQKALDDARILYAKKLSGAKLDAKTEPFNQQLNAIMSDIVALQNRFPEELAKLRKQESGLDLFDDNDINGEISYGSVQFAETRTDEEIEKSESLARLGSAALERIQSITDPEQRREELRALLARVEAYIRHHLKRPDAVSSIDVEDARHHIVSDLPSEGKKLDHNKMAVFMERNKAKFDQLWKHANYDLVEFQNLLSDLPVGLIEFILKAYGGKNYGTKIKPQQPGGSPGQSGGGGVTTGRDANRPTEEGEGRSGPRILTLRPDDTRVPQDFPSELGTAALQLRDALLRYSFLHPHQIHTIRLAIDALIRGDNFGIMSGPGTGKTLCQLVIAQHWLTQTEHPILIITDRRIVIEQAYAGDAKMIDLELEYDLQKLQSDATAPTTGKVFVATYYDLTNNKIPLDRPYGLIVFDEAHNLKNVGTSKKAGRGVELIDIAEHHILATATPIDKDIHNSYLSKFFGFADPASAMAYLGAVWRKTKGGGYWHHPNPGEPGYVNPRTRWKLIEELYTKATRDGRMIQHEIDLADVQIRRKSIQLSDEAQSMLRQIDAWYDAEIAAAPNKKSNLEGRRKLTLRSMIEGEKVDETIATIKEEIAAGRVVVLYFYALNPIDKVFKATPANPIELEFKRKSTLNELIEKLGISKERYAVIHGKVANPDVVAKDFIAGLYDIIFVQGEFSAGISLDDRVGDRPRTMVMMSLPLNSVTFIQQMGRIDRLTTKSLSRIVTITADHGIDTWGVSLIEQKLRTLDKAIKGRVEKIKPAELGELGENETDEVSDVDAYYDEEEFRRAFNMSHEEFDHQTKEFFALIERMRAGFKPTHQLNLDEGGVVQMNPASHRAAQLLPAQRRVVNIFERDKYIDFSGKIRLSRDGWAQEIADIYQVYRNPRFETLHYVFLAADGTIIKTSSISSGALGRVAIDPKMIDTFIRQAKALGAVQVIQIHNHPSGNPEPSHNDLVSTVKFDKRLRAAGMSLRGHVIIDSGKYGLIEVTGDNTTTSNVYSVTNPVYTEWDSTVFTRERILSKEDMATIGRSIQIDPSMVGFLYVTRHYQAIGFIPHSIDVLNRPTQELMDMVREEMNAVGGGYLFIVGHFDFADKHRNLPAIAGSYINAGTGEIIQNFNKDYTGISFLLQTRLGFADELEDVHDELNELFSKMLGGTVRSAKLRADEDRQMMEAIKKIDALVSQIKFLDGRIAALGLHTRHDVGAAERVSEADNGPHDWMYRELPDKQWQKAKERMNFLQGKTKQKQGLTADEDAEYLNYIRSGLSDRQIREHIEESLSGLRPRHPKATIPSLGVSPSVGGEGPTIVLGWLSTAMGPNTLVNPINLSSSGGFKPIESPELYRLVQRLLAKSKVIGVNRRLGDNVRGAFHPTTEFIQLNPEIFKDAALLHRVVSHEIFHLVDFLPDKDMARGNLVGRIHTLKRYMLGTYGASTVTDKQLRQELKALSMFWRPWDPTTASASFITYRNSAEELYADFGSMLLVSPGAAEGLAPKFFKEFFDNLDTKPEVKDAYFELQELLTNDPDEILARRQQRRRFAYARAADVRDVVNRERKNALKSTLLRWRALFGTYFAPVEAKVWDFKKDITPPEGSPLHYLEELSYLTNDIVLLHEKIDKRVLSILMENDLTFDDIGEFGELNRIMGQREQIANPALEVPITAVDGLEFMRRKLGDTRFLALIRAVTEFHEIVFEYVSEATDVGLINRGTFDSIVRPNVHNYMAFKQVDKIYEYPDLPAGIKPLRGSVDEIENPFLSTLLKLHTMIYAIGYQKARSSFVSFMITNFPSEIAEVQKVFIAKGHSRLKPARRGKATLKVFRNGAIVGYDVDPFLAEVYDRNSSQTLQIVSRALDVFNHKYFKSWVTTYRLGFSLYSNIFRDFVDTYKRNPDIKWYNPFELLKAYVKAAPNAIQLAHGDLSPTTREMFDLKAMKAAPYFDFDVDYSLDPEMKQWLTRYKIVKDNKVDESAVKSLLFAPLRKLRDALMYVGMVGEYTGKIAGFMLRKSHGEVGQRLAYNTRNYTSTPNYSNRAPWTSITDGIAPFANITMEGLKAQYRVASNPTTASGYWMKTFLSALLPKLILAMILWGMFGEYLRRLAKKIPSYYKTNYLCLPLFELEDGKVFFIPLPHTEVDRLFGGMLYHALTTDGDAIEAAKSALQFGAGQTPIGITPVLKVPFAWSQYLYTGQAYDFYRNKGVLPQTMEKAGPTLEGTQRMLGWSISQWGFATMSSYDPREKSGIETAIQVTPLLERVIKISDFGAEEEVLKMRKDVERVQARSSLERHSVSDNVREFDKMAREITTRASVWKNLYRLERQSEMVTFAAEHPEISLEPMVAIADAELDNKQKAIDLIKLSGVSKAEQKAQIDSLKRAMDFDAAAAVQLLKGQMKTLQPSSSVPVEQ
jgi:hypothetical protein